jgi:hypothetical protein
MFRCRSGNDNQLQVGWQNIGDFERVARGVITKRRGRFFVAGDMPFANAGAFLNPLVIRIEKAEISSFVSTFSGTAMPQPTRWAYCGCQAPLPLEVPL